MIVASSCDNVELLLSGKVDELNCITGYTDCEVCVLFLLGVLHSVDELLFTEYVYIEVVCALIKVTVQYVNQVGLRALPRCDRVRSGLMVWVLEIPSSAHS